MPRPDHRPKSSPKVVGNEPWRLSTFLSLCLHRGGCPLVGEQFGQLVLRMLADAFEEIAQVSEGIEAKPFASRDEAGEHGRRAAAAVATVKHPVLASYRDTAQTALGAVVVDLQIAVVQVAGKGLPIRQRVGAGLALGTL